MIAALKRCATQKRLLRIVGSFPAQAKTGVEWARDRDFMGNRIAGGTCPWNPTLAQRTRKDGAPGFAEDSTRSAAAWKRVLKRLVQFGYLEQLSEEVYEITEEGFARADENAASTPLHVSLSFAGTPDKQILCADANRPITLERLDFLMSSEVQIASSDLSEPTGTTAKVPLDPKKIGELFASPRPDKNGWDHAGPAALRLVFVSDGQRSEVMMPILLQPKFVNNTQWIQVIGSKAFTLKPE